MPFLLCLEEAEPITVCIEFLFVSKSLSQVVLESITVREVSGSVGIVQVCEILRP